MFSVLHVPTETMQLLSGAYGACIAYVGKLVFLRASRADVVNLTSNHLDAIGCCFKKCHPDLWGLAPHQTQVVRKQALQQFGNPKH